MGGLRTPLDHLGVFRHTGRLRLVRRSRRKGRPRGSRAGGRTLSRPRSGQGGLLSPPLREARVKVAIDEVNQGALIGRVGDDLGELEGLVNYRAGGGACQL